jgi:hypothetical protein
MVIMPNDKRSLISGPLTLFILLNCLFFNSSPGLSQEERVPDFHSVDLDGSNISLSKYIGEPVLLHITNIENPLAENARTPFVPKPVSYPF